MEGEKLKMAATKQTKVITRRKKFISVDVPLARQNIELIGAGVEDVEGRTIKLDLTRQLKGKSVEAVVKIKNEEGKAVAYPVKIRLMPYFIRRIMRKRISYVEDSFEIPSQESMLRVKPFLITRKKVSRAVRKALRNKAKNWLEDYISMKTNDEFFDEVLNNKVQRPLSLSLKKTYPLSFCEIRALEIGRDLTDEEKKAVSEKAKGVKVEKKAEAPSEEVIDQMQEIEEEKKKKAEEEIKETQGEAVKKEEKASEDLDVEVKEASKQSFDSSNPKNSVPESQEGFEDEEKVKGADGVKVKDGEKVEEELKKEISEAVEGKKGEEKK